MFVRMLYIIIFVGLIAAPVTLLILPGDFFDTGKSICLSVVLFDTPCYGCGMTRAIQHLLHFDFKGAFHLNPISFVVLPVAGVVWFSELRKAYRRIKAA